MPESRREPTLVANYGDNLREPLNEAFLFSSSGTSLPRAVVTRASYFAKTKRYVVGPSVQVQLPLRLAAEFNVLYRRLNYDNNFYTRSPSSGEFFVNTNNVANKWEFPLLMQYRWLFRVFSGQE